MKKQSFEVFCHKQIRNARSKRCPDRVSGHTIRWQWKSMIRTTYPDRICYRPGCDVHECRVLLPEGVRIAWRRVSSWGIWMELLRIAMRAPCHQGEGSLYHAHADSPPCDVPPTPDISHPEFCPVDVPPSQDISHLDISQPDGRGGYLNFPCQTCPDPLIALTRRVFLSVYSVAVFS